MYTCCCLANDFPQPSAVQEILSAGALPVWTERSCLRRALPVEKLCAQMWQRWQKTSECLASWWRRTSCLEWNPSPHRKHRMGRVVWLLKVHGLNYAKRSIMSRAVVISKEVFLFIFFSLCTHPSFVMTLTQDIRDLFARCHPNDQAQCKCNHTTIFSVIRIEQMKQC